MYKYTIPVTNALPAEAQSLYAELLAENHLLIGGVTGSGKSVLLNGLMYQAMHSSPLDVPGGKQFILIDPKMTELADYKNLPHTIMYADDDRPIYSALEYARRLIEVRNRTTSQLREAGIQREKGYVGSDVYIVIDELLAVVLNPDRKMRKDMVASISKIAYIGRSVKVHLLACTQRPTRDVLDPVIVGNVVSRVGLRTRDAQESRNIIESFGRCKDLPRYGEAYVSTPSRMEPEKVSIPMIDDAALMECVQDWVQQKKEADAEAAMLEAQYAAEPPTPPPTETRGECIFVENAEYGWRGTDYDMVSTAERKRRINYEFLRRIQVIHGEDPHITQTMRLMSRCVG